MTKDFNLIKWIRWINIFRKQLSVINSIFNLQLNRGFSIATSNSQKSCLYGVQTFLLLWWVYIIWIVYRNMAFCLKWGVNHLPMTISSRVMRFWCFSQKNGWYIAFPIILKVAWYVKSFLRVLWCIFNKKTLCILNWPVFWDMWFRR